MDLYMKVNIQWIYVCRWTSNGNKIYWKTTMVDTSCGIQSASCELVQGIRISLLATAPPPTSLQPHLLPTSLPFPDVSVYPQGTPPPLWGFPIRPFGGGGTSIRFNCYCLSIKDIGANQNLWIYYPSEFSLFSDVMKIDILLVLLFYCY